MVSHPPLLDRALYNALWLGEHFAGSSVGDRYFAPARRLVNLRVIAGLRERKPVRLQPVKVLEGPGIKPRVREFIRRQIPVVIKGAAGRWPCVGHWSPEFFAREYGDFPIEFDSLGTGLTRSTFEDFVPRLLSPKGSGEYARFSPIVHEHPELKDDLDVGWFEQFKSRLEFWVARQLFIGGPKTSSKLHAAFISNFFVQIHGRKRWVLFSPVFNSAFMPPVDRSTTISCSREWESPSFEEDSLFSRIQGFETELDPGDILFNPPFFWHQVENLTVSIGLSCRYFSATNAMLSSPMLAMLTAFSRNPNALHALLKSRRGEYDVDLSPTEMA